MKALKEGDERVTSSDFWSYFLYDKNFNWDVDIQKLIEYVLASPVSSADAERAFSVMKHIKGNRRSSMGKDLLEAHVRIRVNGPLPELYQPYNHVRQWVCIIFFNIVKKIEPVLYFPYSNSGCSRPLQSRVPFESWETNGKKKRK